MTHDKDESVLDTFDEGGGHPSPDKLLPYDFTPDQVKRIRAALKLADEMQWRPIETAPKDGRLNVLIKTEYNSVFEGYRDLKGRWTAEDPRGGGDYYISGDITDWMPVPKEIEDE